MEHLLIADLAARSERIADEEFCRDLWRALANGVWRKDDATVSPSWSGAERLVNELRLRNGYEPLEVVQTGGEGEVSELVADELERLGWTREPLDTDRNVAEHKTSDAASPPRAENEPMRWEREAREAADENRSPVYPERTTER